MAPQPHLNETAGSILGFLTLGPMTGWDLNEIARISVGNFWNVTHSQIYRELKSLATAGLVEGEDLGERRKRRYAVTKAGRSAFDEWIRTQPGPGTTRSPFLVRLFFAEALSPGERRTLLEEAQEAHRSKLQQYREILGAAEQLSPFAAATARYGIAVEEATLDWFERERDSLLPS